MNVGIIVNEIDSKTLVLIEDAVKPGKLAGKSYFQPHHYKHYHNAPAPARREFADVEGYNYPIFHLIPLLKNISQRWKSWRTDQCLTIVNRGVGSGLLYSRIATSTEISVKF